jgi:hypothetical protein
MRELKGEAEKKQGDKIFRSRIEEYFSPSHRPAGTALTVPAGVRGLLTATDAHGICIADIPRRTSAQGIPPRERSRRFERETATPEMPEGAKAYSAKMSLPNIEVLMQHKSDSG